MEKKMKKMLIVDVESTCFERGHEPSGFFSEIIEIGAVIFNPDTRSIEAEIQIMVKPILFPILSDFCKTLTTIEQHEVANALNFNEACKQLQAFRTPHDAVFCSWGDYDKNQFKRVCDRFKVVYPFTPQHFNLKEEHGNFYSKKPMGMAGALRLHQIPLDGTHHRGLDDAKNIAKIASYLVKDGWNHTLLS
jgi:3'-5' exoribonuclease 1